MSGRNVVRQSSRSGGSGEAFGTLGPSPLISVSFPLVVLRAIPVCLSDSKLDRSFARAVPAAIAGQALSPALLGFSGLGTLRGYRASGLPDRITARVRIGCVPACRAARRTITSHLKRRSGKDLWLDRSVLLSRAGESILGVACNP